MQKSRSKPELPVGVLLFASAGERIAGDPGAPGTFDFPVEYGVVPGSYRDLLQGSDQVRERLCEAARELEGRGVCAIAGHHAYKERRKNWDGPYEAYKKVDPYQEFFDLETVTTDYWQPLETDKWAQFK